MFFSIVCPVFGETPAVPYHPARPITVVAESVAPRGAYSGKDGQFWHIAPETGEDGTFFLGFYQEASGQPSCRLVPDAGDSRLYLSDGTRFRSAAYGPDIMIFPGFSVPCDILPVATACTRSEPHVTEVRRQVGERTFVEKLQVNCRAVATAEAVDKGWIKAAEDDMEPLVMIRIISLESGENVSSQLWIPGDAWWLYEETPYRRSWRLR